MVAESWTFLDQNWNMQCPQAIPETLHLFWKMFERDLRKLGELVKQ